MYQVVAGDKRTCSPVTVAFFKVLPNVIFRNNYLNCICLWNIIIPILYYLLVYTPIIFSFLDYRISVYSITRKTLKNGNTSSAKDFRLGIWDEA